VDDADLGQALRDGRQDAEVGEGVHAQGLGLELLVGVELLVGFRIEVLVDVGSDVLGAGGDGGVEQRFGGLVGGDLLGVQLNDLR